MSKEVDVEELLSEIFEANEPKGNEWVNVKVIEIGYRINVIALALVMIPQVWAVIRQDDGYIIPENATVIERAKIQSQNFYLWVKTGMPGELIFANPYCDEVTDEYMASGGLCHDRKDASETTGLFTCNDFTHVKNWTECKDATK